MLYSIPSSGMQMQPVACTLDKKKDNQRKEPRIRATRRNPGMDHACEAGGHQYQLSNAACDACALFDYVTGSRHVYSHESRILTLIIDTPSLGSTQKNRDRFVSSRGAIAPPAASTSLPRPQGAAPTRRESAAARLWSMQCSSRLQARSPRCGAAQPSACVASGAGEETSQLTQALPARARPRADVAP
jgi:hypothetical protein